ncbi:hypothetical protein HYT26_04430 [Candidatus Pacearchaeota archaeon]|nr:hypothetical protein [Candidatus Pacearchaeota archaeon]
MKFKLEYIIIGLIIVFAVIVLISGYMKKQEVTITTDKTEYEPGENITITIKNNLIQVIDFFNIEIEGFIDNKWQTANRDIECGCLEFCTKIVASLWPWEAKQYIWNQEICQNLNFAKFRVKILAKEYSKAGGRLKWRGDLTFFSNEFEIKEEILEYEGKLYPSKICRYYIEDLTKEEYWKTIPICGNSEIDKLPEWTTVKVRGKIAKKWFECPVGSLCALANQWLTVLNVTEFEVIGFDEEYCNKFDAPKACPLACAVCAYPKVLSYTGCHSKENCGECSTDSDCKDLNCSIEEKPEPQPECVNNTCKCTYSYCKEIGGCD